MKTRRAQKFKGIARHAAAKSAKLYAARKGRKRGAR
jgi:hypothetical protein